MITREQLLNSLLNYIDNEIISKLPTSGKWYLGSMMFLLSNKYNKLVDDLASNSVVKSLNIVDDKGLIDSDALLKAMKQAANKYGKLTINIPIIGTLYFSSEDIDTLRQYINGGNTR